MRQFPEIPFDLSKPELLARLAYADAQIEQAKMYAQLWLLKEQKEQPEQRVDITQSPKVDATKMAQVHIERIEEIGAFKYELLKRFGDML